MNKEFNGELPRITIKDLRELSGMTQEAFSDYLAIPIGTIRNWESSNNKLKRECKPYVIDLLEHRLIDDGVINPNEAFMIRVGRLEKEYKEYQKDLAKQKELKKKLEEKKKDEANEKLHRIARLVDELSLKDVSEAIKETKDEKEKSLYKALKSYLFMNGENTVSSFTYLK